MTPGLVVRTVLVVLVVLVVQLTVGLSVVVAGAHPDLLVLLPIVAGLAAGPEAGALMGFFAGLVADLFVPAPFGLSALVGVLVGFAAGSVVTVNERSPRWLVPIVALTGSAAAVMLYAVLGAVLGDEQFLKLDLGAIVAVVSITNALLAVPAFWLIRWSLGLTGPDARRPQRARR